MPLVHRPAAGTLSDASTAGIPAGAGRCIRPSPAGCRPPGQVPDCQALPDLVCRDSAGSESPAATRPSSFVLISCSIPQGVQRGNRSAPFASFQEGSGRETQGSRRKPTKCGGELPRRSKRSPFGGVAPGKGGAAEGVSRRPLGSGEGYGACDDAIPPRIVLRGCGGVFFPNGKNTPPPAAGLRPLAALPPARAEIPLSPSEAVISFHRMV